MMKTDLSVVNPSLVLNRECYACGSNETYVKPNGRKSWYSNGNGLDWFCEKCNNRYFKNPKWHPITNPITHKKNGYKSCNCGRGHKARPSSGVTENYSPLPSSMGEVVSQFAAKTEEQIRKEIRGF